MTNMNEKLGKLKGESERNNCNIKITLRWKTKENEEKTMMG